MMNAAPHLIYGPGEDALALTVEHGGVRDEEQTKAIQDFNNRKLICQQNGMRKLLVLHCKIDNSFDDFLERFWQKLP